MTQARGGGSRARSWTGSRGLPKVSHGSGIYVYDNAGKRYLDASGGPAVFCLGHGHPEVTAAIVEEFAAAVRTPADPGADASRFASGSMRR